MHAFDVTGAAEARLCDGISEPAIAAISAALARTCLERTVFLVDRHQRAAEQWAEDLALMLRLGGREAIRILPFPQLPEEDPETFDTSTEDGDWDRNALLTALTDDARLRHDNASGNSLILVPTTPRALTQAVRDPENFIRSRIELHPGTIQPIAALVQQIETTLDYDREAVCEAPGQFAVRGSLLDIYPTGANAPVRIDYFDDEIESIRTFDPTTQRSDARLDRIVLTPRRTVAESDGASRRNTHLAAYIADRPALWFLREPGRLAAENPSALLAPPVGSARHQSFIPFRERPAFSRDRWFGLTAHDDNPANFPESIPRTTYQTEPLANLRTLPDLESVGSDRINIEFESRIEFLREIAQRINAGWHLEIFFNNDGEENRFREIVADDPSLAPIANRAVFRRGSLHEGSLIEFRKPVALSDNVSTKWILATDSEIFGRYRTRLSGIENRRRAHHSEVDRLLDFADLADGDYLVHLAHGICIFRGIEAVPIDRRDPPTTEEMIALEFADGLRIQTPFRESHLLSRYVGFANRAPRLGKPGSANWRKARENAERSTLDFASQLLRLQAKRDLLPGYAFTPDTPWQREFETAFPFRETPDQLTAIREAKEDMEQARPMDRLLCGDVGFGKTEVAIRTAFKAVMDGKQVAILVPTTVLAQQHYQTFRERMADFPVTVEMLSRFRKPARQREILRLTAEGRIDILIGTHALLGRQLLFKDLGLLVIDEEHRFGVKQKETLKLIRENVDVLSMSATPIPRTLYLALAGARDLSVIETPPRNRRPVQTFVKPWSEKLIRQAIRFELDRGGQVFFLHNRVQSIDAKAEELRQLVPEARIGVGHGQMDEKLLEQVMLAFTRGEYDVLLSTTIIESGLDIPNSNTMIIEGADRFGLAQLYQLRGRIGRFNRQAYAYLLLPQKAPLLDPARKRLEAIRQNTRLGAGYRIAMRDLELRGAGNLIGSEQSGTIAGVGFDLYCQLLRQSVARLRGEPGASAIRAQIRLDFITTGSGPITQPDAGASRITGERRGPTGPCLRATIPEDYISETRLRLDLYRKLSIAATPEAVRSIAEDIRDRFGPPPEGVEALIGITMIRTTAEQKGITTVEVSGNNISGRRIRDGREVPFRPASRLTRKNPLPRLRELFSLVQRDS